MSRTPVAATARLERISVRATEAEKRDLDWIRGALSRSDYVRALIHDATQRYIALGHTRP